MWLAAGLVLLLAGCVTTLLTLPTWGAPLLRDALVERLQRRAELPVSVDAVKLSWGSVVVDGLVIGDPARPLVQIEEIVATLDRDALWRGRAVARDVVVEGGRVEGGRQELEALARRVLRRRTTADEEEDRGEGRIRLVPDTAAMRRVRVVVRDTGASERPRRLETMLEVEAEPRSKRADVILRDVRVDPGKGPEVTAARLQTSLEVRRSADGPAIAFPLELRIEGLGAPITQQIAVAGVDGRVRLADAQISEVEAELAGTFSDASDGPTGDKLWELVGTVRRDLSRGVLRVNMESFELGRIPQVLRRLPLVESAGATVGGHLAVVFGAGVARLEGDVSVQGLNVDHRMLARTTVRDVGFDLQLAVEIDPAARRVDIDHAVLSRRGVELRLRGELEHPPQKRGRRYRLEAGVPPVDCQAVLDAIPAELIPSLQGFQLEGRFDAEVDADVDYADLEALVLGGRIGIWNCKVVRAPGHATAARLAAPFVHRVTMRDGRRRSVHLYEGSGSFTPLGAISPYMQAAVLTTEDGGFYHHRGFLPSQFRTALQRNLAAGKIRLGASTISMQMVKNVLLSHERTLSRKLQEMFLTWYLETALAKARIMEIYLNVIEFGPGIYGVTRAAEHYFGKHPGDLTLPEAAYLSLMLPSPVRRHVHYCRGELNPAFRIKLQRILRIMHERERIDDLDYEIWKDTEIVFDPTERGDEASCLDEIEALMRAQEGQRALSGLLGDGEEPAPLELAKLPPPPTDTPDPSAVDAPGRPVMDASLPDEGEPW